MNASPTSMGHNGLSCFANGVVKGWKLFAWNLEIMLSGAVSNGTTQRSSLLGEVALARS